MNLSKNPNVGEKPRCKIESVQFHVSPILALYKTLRAVAARESFFLNYRQKLQKWKRIQKLCRIIKISGTLVKLCQTFPSHFGWRRCLQREIFGKFYSGNTCKFHKRNTCKFIQEHICSSIQKLYICSQLKIYMCFPTKIYIHFPVDNLPKIFPNSNLRQNFGQKWGELRESFPSGQNYLH